MPKVAKKLCWLEDMKLRIEVGDILCESYSLLSCYEVWIERWSSTEVYKGFEILEHIGKVIYWLTLSSSMNHIHNVFYVLLLCKYISDLTNVLRVEDVEHEDNLVCQEHLVQILDRQVK